MESRYKIIISNKNLYKEINLTPDMEQLTVGTAIGMDVRLRKELFGETISLIFTRVEEEWKVVCSDNLYFKLGDVRKLVNLQLKHGTEMKVCCQDSNNEIFLISLLIDFDYEKKDYNRKIDISKQKEIKIGGGQEADILLTDRYIGEDVIVLKRQEDKLYLVNFESRYGTYVNGMRVSKQKEIREYDFFSIGCFSFYYREECLFTSMKQNICLKGLGESEVENQSTVFEYPRFNRNTRIQYSVPEEKIEIQQPTAKAVYKKKSILLTILPAIVMLGVTIVLRGIIGGGGNFVIYSVISMSMGIIVSIVTYVQEKKAYKEDSKKREEAYEKYITDKERLIRESRENELRIRRVIYESLEKSLQEAKTFGKRLFEKTIDDKDYLHVYLGTGQIESQNQVAFSKQELIDAEDPLVLLPEQLAEKYRYIEDAPIVSDFNMACGIGVIGNKAELKQMLKNMTLDLAIRHFFKEVRLAYILDDEYIEEFQWIRWLHNVENEQLDVRNIVCDEESKNLLLETFYTILSGRENLLVENKEYIFEEQYVVFVTNTSSIIRHPVSKYIQNCSEYGFTFVFLEEYEENLPMGCTEIICLCKEEKGHALKSANGESITEFAYPMISDKTAEEIAIKLGAVYVDEVSLEGQLTKNISMFELLDIISVEDLDLKERWAASEVYKTIAAPIGVKSNNEIVALDISDKSGAHGPHGLVAGTTGSGKSEILQTYILSVAVFFHPYDVSFVVIDFKGGGMANQFKDLPHLIGTITNIDGREIDRSLLSIKAELVKRQEMFMAAGVNHINDYIKLYKAKKVNIPMPHLIMIVDEFAELKAEYPDFMKELISAARIGRTLGVHLILATQKPAGVVDAQIWSNSKFKLCLKVQTKEDSNEVLKTPLAAEIVEPGRAYFQVGNNEIFELIQSAYSGANVPVGNDVSENIYSIYERNLWGKKELKYTNKKKQKVDSEVTQLQAIVDYVRVHCVSNNIEKLPGICLPSLEAVIHTDRLDYSLDNVEVISIPVGFYDDPEQQRQGIVNIELSKDNVYIVGSAQMGKTVFLQTIIYGVIKKYTPKQVNMYLIDCGSMVLKLFESSKHVGGVVLASEEEKCKNLFKLLNDFVVKRKGILSGKGVGNYSAYLEAGYTDMPLIVVVIDNMAAFKEYFPNQADELNSLSREAQGVGISFVITSATSNALNYRTQANFGKRFVLSCNDSGEYSNAFGHCRKTPREYAGSGLVMMDKRILEWQVAMFGKSNKEAERSQEMRNYIEQRNVSFGEIAIQIPMVPEKLVLEDVMKQDVAKFRASGVIPLGMDFATIDYSMLDMNQTGSLALLGDMAARMQFTKALIYILARNIVFHNMEAVVIDDKAKNLESVRNYGFVKNYTSDVAEGLAMLSDFYDELNMREEAEKDSDETTIILVLNNPEVFRQICADKNASKELVSAMKRASDIKAFMLLTQVENQAVGFNSSDVLKAIREERKGVLFAPISENKFFEVAGRIRMDSLFDRTMGYRFENGTYSKIKIFE